MSFQFNEIQSQPDADSGVLDQLGFLTSSFTVSFLRACPDCVCLISPLGAVQYVNVNGRALLGLDQAGSTGMNWSDIWPTDSREAVAAALSTALEGRTVRCTAKLGYVNAPDICCDVTMAPVLSSRGEVEAVTAILREIPSEDC